MKSAKTYIGVDNDIYGGMTPIGKVIRDAKVFGLISDEETCKGWTSQGIDSLLEKVNKEWDKYGCLVRHLPPELAERHAKLHGDAIKRAKELGWNGEVETDDER
ncbi:MAG: hypothetical protein OEX00_02350 [Gammaproteobacteria bacterium]|nr:hypothetical protein [Gammaproteobacteria bacterium]MDH5693982.1 hypothetical protein [Gammaproteobacteria bacterium]